MKFLAENKIKNEKITDDISSKNLGIKGATKEVADSPPNLSIVSAKAPVANDLSVEDEDFF